MVLNSFDDVAKLEGLESLLGNDGVLVVQRHVHVVQVAIDLLGRGWVSEGALVVGNGPLGGAHDSEVVVAVGVDRAQEGVLGGEALRHCTQQQRLGNLERLTVEEKLLVLSDLLGGLHFFLLFNYYINYI